MPYPPWPWASQECTLPIKVQTTTRFADSVTHSVFGVVFAWSLSLTATLFLPIPPPSIPHSCFPSSSTVPRPALYLLIFCPATFTTHLLHGPISPALSSVAKNQHLARRYRPAISYLTTCFSYRSLAANTDMGFAIVSPTTVSDHVHQPVSLRRNHHAWKKHYDQPRPQFLRITLSLVARASFNSATT